ncbi:C_GCAxxG_C_C family probable redox protein [Methanofollis sp. W23]|uniref:C-GCAxxG-C-C family protein n=1 Tax=Methanofollis sp. W23 TaxID=2817849 RepID=UPI001AEA0D00|nr:C-GCAxxG-C-C family protein [Methanofollis sp. W23]MBP2146679.1 C_GCAxxG_C_C family probable redox protein [Methanofollis sp. W23]
MSVRSKRAAASFSDGLNCAQAVAGAFAQECGTDEATVRKLACGFGGGLAHTGRTCGAVSGGVLVLGLARGTAMPGDREGKEHCYTLVQEFLRRFADRHGAVECTPLIGYDLSDPQGIAAAKEVGAFATRCTGYVQDAVEIVEDLLKAP